MVSSFSFRFLILANICPWLWGELRTAAEVNGAVAAVSRRPAQAPLPPQPDYFVVGADLGL